MNLKSYIIIIPLGNWKKHKNRKKIEYSNREVCILDEANSSADIYYEKQLEELIIKKMQKKTLIMITHRLDILSKVDKIIFLKENQEYAVGNYYELINADSEFKAMIVNK